jgi:hypothetical protein
MRFLAATVGRRPIAALTVTIAMAGCSFHQNSDEREIKQELRAVAMRARPLRVDPSEPLVAIECRRTDRHVGGHVMYLCTVEFEDTVVPDVCAYASADGVLVGGQEHGASRCTGQFRTPRPVMFT